MSYRTSCKHNGESEFNTSMSSQIYVFKWNIKNFPDWPDTFKVTSSEFKPANDIVLYATFERFIDESENKKCYLKIISKEKTPFEVEDQLSFTYSTGRVFHKIKTTNFVCTQNENSWRYIIFADKLEEHSRSAENNIVVFKCIMKFKELATENVDRLRFKCSKNVPNLIEDFKTMYTDSLYTDFSFVVDNNVVRVHKSVLCARSPVLARMLKYPLEEEKKDTIKIVDIDLPTLKTFIEFLYTGSVPTDVDFDSWCRLYYAADKSRKIAPQKLKLPQSECFITIVLFRVSFI
ncbi:hypothetical protein JTE90_024471 [Oedothorax gibbosus]|uniref:BTB domain-containing protein n=1 Tax=Oedothorax gibbosus TaxID=931172 RepID=A0AAV6UJR5_9ARAC|nr:hypothetical protein JTE90_024471 [Oedothorax gibbosus]